MVHYTYDDQVIAEYEGGSLKRKFIYGPGIDEPVMMINVDGETETKYYYHFDGLGSVAAVSDETGGVAERYSYDVFGEPNRVSDVNNPYMFTARRYDPETANYYYRARYYKPSIGRFLQTDPIGYYGGLNLYLYVLNNPVILIDPVGLTGFVRGGGAYPYSIPAPKPRVGISKAPIWHTHRNMFNNCPPKEPNTDCPEWRKDPWYNYHHWGRRCYRRSDPTGVGGSQCCYFKDGTLDNYTDKRGTYDYVSPRPWDPISWYYHRKVDIVPHQEYYHEGYVPY